MIFWSWLIASKVYHDILVMTDQAALWMQAAAIITERRRALMHCTTLYYTVVHSTVLQIRGCNFLCIFSPVFAFFELSRDDHQRQECCKTDKLDKQMFENWAVKVLFVSREGSAAKLYTTAQQGTCFSYVVWCAVQILLLCMVYNSKSTNSV